MKTWNPRSETKKEFNSRINRESKTKPDWWVEAFNVNGAPVENPWKPDWRTKAVQRLKDHFREKRQGSDGTANLELHYQIARHFPPLNLGYDLYVGEPPVDPDEIIEEVEAGELDLWECICYGVDHADEKARDAKLAPSPHHHRFYVLARDNRALFTRYWLDNFPQKSEDLGKQQKDVDIDKALALFQSLSHCPNCGEKL